MAIFKRQASSVAVPPEVATLLYAAPNAKTYNNLKNLTKMVEKNFGAIQSYLLPGEQIHMITFGRDYAGMDDVGVMTTLGCFAARKGRIDRERLLWKDVEAVTSGRLPNGNKFVSVRTVSYRLDYRQDDPARLNQEMSFAGEVERDVETVLTAIQMLRSRTPGS